MRKQELYCDLAKRLDDFVADPAIGYPKFTKKWYKNNISAILIERHAPTQIDNVCVPTYLRFRLQIDKHTTSAFLLPIYMYDEFLSEQILTKRKQIANFFDELMPSKSDNDIIQYDMLYMSWLDFFNNYPQDAVELIDQKQDALASLENQK